MRYAHMVRKYDTGLLGDGGMPTRKFVPLSKHATTVALDVRRVLRSLRGPRLVLVLIVVPFIVAVLIALAHPRRSRPAAAVPANLAGVPVSFQKYGYDQIRAGHSKPVKFRARILLSYYHKALSHRRKFLIDPKKSITLIAACKNRKESLALALPSWEGVKEIDEIVLVDWGSDTHDWQDLPLLHSLVKSGRVSFVQVQKAGDWVLTRAYNLAVKFAVGKYILKADCDTHLDPDFVLTHPRPDPGKYYSVGWGTERNENEEKLRGIWFASKEDFLKVGGYDERLVDYGYEEMDLYDRWHKFAGLEAQYLNLDKLRHSVADDVIWKKTKSKTSHRTSIRMNKAILENAPPWREVVANGHVTEYAYAYSQKDASVFATILRSAPDPLAGKTQEERAALKEDVLQKTLHDEHHMPWDIVPSFSLSDLEYLADYLDSGSESRIVVVCLDGPDAISNVFNLVSAVQLGLTVSRPVIAIWRGLDGVDVDQSGGPILRQLFDLEATNVLLEQVPQSETAKKHKISGPTRLIAAKEWPCVEELSECAAKYDDAYDSFSELVMRMPHLYDETDTLPLSILRNGLLKLSNKTKIGSEETRALAFKSLVQSHIVRVAQKAFPAEAQVGVVSELGENLPSLASNVRSKHGSAIGSQEVLPIVGVGHHTLRRDLVGDEKGKGFCEGSSCSIGQLAKEVANVLAMCSAKKFFPAAEAADRESWVVRKDVTSMMVADLQVLHQKY